uniref:hypothetical protein n=1 Tax=Candidatus Ventrenecus sp. TaxID=3085654 RepID=UPI004025A8EA
MNKKKKIVLTIVILLVTITVIGVSYAYWILSFSSVNPNKVATSCLSLSLTNEKNDINLPKAYPISDAEGKKLTPYSFTITNTCDLFLSYTVNLEVLNESTMPYKYIKAMVNNEAITNLNALEDNTTTLDNASTSKILVKGTLGTDDSADYNIRLWMDEDVTVNDTDSMNTTFLSKVTIGAQRSTYIPSEQGYTTLADAILANEYQTTPEISKQKIAAKQAVDFSKTAPILIWNESKTTNLSSTSAIMPHPDLVALKDSDERFKNLTNEYVLLPIGTGYTFNSETGKYAITNIQQLDPTTLIYGGDTKYYFCSAGYSTNSSDVITVYKNTANCATTYEITNASITDGTSTGSVGTTIKTRTYNLKGYAMTQSERESDKSDKGLYQMEDDDGISYYYRGSVSNNYVKYAGSYWRIIRINGDGSVRLLYAGTTMNASGTDLNIKSWVAFNTKSDNPAYSVYMYGSTLNESYEKTTANENDSNIKKVLDDWYKNNILGTSNESVVADAGFCNDRSFYSGNGYTVTGSDTIYEPYRRYYQTKQPTLKCPQTNDLFTLSTSEKGNKALTYPIGLITVDELMMSGYADGYINKSAYTYSTDRYWSLSSSLFYTGALSARVFVLHSEGYPYGYFDVTYTSGVRAVVNLSSAAQISGGIGTSFSPYEIVTE